MTRYRQTPVPALATLAGDTLSVRFDALHQAIAPGQLVRSSIRAATKCSRRHDPRGALMSDAPDAPEPTAEESSQSCSEPQ